MPTLPAKKKSPHKGGRGKGDEDGPVPFPAAAGAGRVRGQGLRKVLRQGHIRVRGAQAPAVPAAQPLGDPAAGPPAGAGDPQHRDDPRRLDTLKAVRKRGGQRRLFQAAGPLRLRLVRRVGGVGQVQGRRRGRRLGGRLCHPPVRRGRVGLGQDLADTAAGQAFGGVERFGLPQRLRVRGPQGGRLPQVRKAVLARGAGLGAGSTFWIPSPPGSR